MERKALKEVRQEEWRMDGEEKNINNIRAKQVHNIEQMLQLEVLW